MGQRDQLSVSLAVAVPEVRDESKDFGRDLVDRGQSIPQGPDQAEDFEGTLFKGSGLKHGMPQLIFEGRSLCSSVSPRSGSSRWKPCGFAFQLSMMTRVSVVGIPLAPGHVLRFFLYCTQEIGYQRSRAETELVGEGGHALPIPARVQADDSFVERFVVD